MANIRDMIPAFELYQPTSVEAALELLDEHRGKSWVLAGGLDSFDWFKDRIKRPEAVIDLGGIEEMNGIREVENGIEIGAMTSLTAIERDERIRSRYSVVADAARHVATPRSGIRGPWGATSPRTHAAGTTGAVGPATAPAATPATRRRPRP